MPACSVRAFLDMAALAEQLTLARKYVESDAMDSCVLQYSLNPTVRESPTNTEFAKKAFSEIIPLATISLNFCSSIFPFV